MSYPINLGPNSPTGYFLYQTCPGKQVTFGYVQDPALPIYNAQGALISSGGWRPFHPADFAANVSVSGLNVTVGAVAVTGNPQVQISNTAPINVTGIVNTVVTGSVSTSVTSVAVTGGQLSILHDDPVALGLLSGISGSLTANLTAPAYVTGQVAISGTTTIQPVTVTGTSNATPSGNGTWSNLTDLRTGMLGLNPSRTLFFVQNIHSGLPLYVALNANAASTGNFSFILNPSQNQGWGGSSFADDHYRGIVQLSGGAYIAWEM